MHPWTDANIHSDFGQHRCRAGPETRRPRCSPLFRWIEKPAGRYLRRFSSPSVRPRSESGGVAGDVAVGRPKHVRLSPTWAWRASPAPRAPRRPPDQGEGWRLRSLRPASQSPSGPRSIPVPAAEHRAVASGTPDYQQHRRPGGLLDRLERARPPRGAPRWQGRRGTQRRGAAHPRRRRTYAAPLPHRPSRHPHRCHRQPLSRMKAALTPSAASSTRLSAPRCRERPTHWRLSLPVPR